MSSRVSDRRILEHELVPEHRVLSFEEAVSLLKRLGAKPWQLPQISLNDPIARLLNAKPGDIIEIKRRSPTGGVHVAYRLVVAFERRGLAMGGGRGHGLDSNSLWTVFRAYIETLGLARQHLDSYNSFVSKKLRQIVDLMGEIRPSWRLRRKQEESLGIVVQDVKIVLKVPEDLREAFSKPIVKEADGYTHPITPYECRVRDISYSAALYADISLIQDGVEVERKRLKIADFPVMVKSVLDPASLMSPEELMAIGEDPKDPGGYFIINGNEKVVVAQEDLAVNRIIVGPAAAGTARITHSAKVVSTTLGVRRQVIVDRMSDGSLEVTVSKLNYRIPFAVLMKALGFEKEVEIAMAVSPDPDVQRELLPSFEKVVDIVRTREDALKFLGNRLAPGQPVEIRVARAEEFLDAQLLPHLGTSPQDRRKKGYYIAEMANRVLQLYLGKRSPDDKDHYSNKRIRLAGDLIAEIFRDSLEVFIRSIQAKLEEHLSQNKRVRLVNLVRPDIITERLRTAIATGNWTQDRTGISQALDRTNWISLLSHLRRVVSPLSRGQAHFEARDLHGTHWGRLCPFETPEGVNCGLVKNLALMAYISVGVDESFVEEMLYRDFGVIPLDDLLDEARRTGAPPEVMLKGSKVFLNGRPIGYHPDGVELAKAIRERRRRNELCHGRVEEHRCFEINVAYIKDVSVEEVYVNTDEGRLLRPAIIVEKGKPMLTHEHVRMLEKGKITFWDLVERGVIEFLDPDEEENAYIGELLDEVAEGHTHLELWPGGVLGVSASTIPYIEHNQSPRNTYQSAMAKQALGLYALNYKYRMDSHSYILQYPQKPITQVKALDLIGYNERPSGQNAVVAIMSYSGYNIEDAVIFNRTSIDYGFARAYFFRVYSAQEQDYPGGLSDRITVPSPKLYDHKGDQYYRKLAPDGIIYPEVEVEGGDILIGRESPPRFMGEERVISTALISNRDTSVQLRYGESGVVDTVVYTRTLEKNKLVKVRVRDLRIPEIGDKFASMHGQKGVIGMVFPGYDMPYTEDGVVPDIILNPHAIPSRMTVGQLLEEIAGKLGAIRARFIDASPFYKEDVNSIRLELLKTGYDPNAREVMYDGRTGEMMERPIVVGVSFFQRLFHMVSDKMHARATGKVQLLTRQPTEGKARQGGLRFGEMERDSLVGHGAAMLTRDRLLEASDSYILYVCNICGHISWYNRRKGAYECPIHGTEGDVKPVKVPYAFKLLLQELISMAVKPEIKVGDKIAILKSVLGEYKPGSQARGVRDVAVRAERFEEPFLIERIVFGLLSPQEIRKLAKVTIVRSDIYEADGSPVVGGLRDPHLGAIEPGERCPTCGNTREECPGHFGKIELARPVLLPHLGDYVYMLLQSTCRRCGRLLLPQDRVEYLRRIYVRLKEKWPRLADVMASHIAREASDVTECPHCGERQFKIRYIRPIIFYERRPEGEVRLTPLDIRDRLERIPDDDVVLLGIDPKRARPEWMVLTVLPVPPLAVRPSITLETGLRAEDDLTHALAEIVRENEKLKSFITTNAPETMIEDAWITLQHVIAAYIDNELPNIYQLTHRKKRPLKTLAQRLKGKEGRLRGNLSGKRVNFSARTVVSPDPYISVNEVGVPVDVAKILTVQMIVTPYNIEEARRYVLNGPYKWPGATFVYKARQERKIDLRYQKNYQQLAEELEPGDIVERHLVDGDIVLFNRQPTLHRMSIMGHIVKVMPGKTFRINLLTCPPYNADFDGDEMNLHVPRLEEARAEARELLLVEKHILTPRYGGPIIGGRQDYISGSYLLTIKTSLFTVEEASRIIARSMVHADLVEPAILKPRPLYTGKQIISMLLPEDLSFKGKAKIGSGDLKCDNENCMADSFIVIRGGKLLMGVLDKNAIGAEQPNNLLHIIALEYGESKAREFLDTAFRSFIRVLEVKGLSMAYSDIEIPGEAKQEVEKLVEKARKEVEELIEQYRRGVLELIPGRTAEESLELKIIELLQRLRTEAGEIAIRHLDSFNDIFIMAKTGARGSDINVTQMAVMLGQQTIRGRRIWRGFRTRTLPHFKPRELSPEARGFIKGNFRDGLKPSELFFHAVAGREGLVDTAVKTSQSGYMQRRLINALQDLVVSYDGTVRDSWGNIIQFKYGEDGVDPMRSYHGKPVSVERVIEMVRSMRGRGNE